MGDAEPPHRKSGSKRRGHRSYTDGPQYEDLYVIAYEESMRTLDDQADELNRIRDRAVQFIVFIGAATAFLVGSGLQASQRDTTFYIIAATASAVSVLMIVLLFLVLNPRNKELWNYRTSVKKMIDVLIETDVPPTKAEFVRRLSRLNDDSREGNERLLGFLRRCYRLLVIIGATQVIIWASLVWAKG